MPAPYPYVNGTLAGQNIMYFFIYANSITSGFAVPLIVVSFFLLVLLSSMLAQIRFSARLRPEVSILAASFSTLGLSVILEQGTGLLNPIYFIATIVATVLSLLWVALGNPD